MEDSDLTKSKEMVANMRRMWAATKDLRNWAEEGGIRIAIAGLDVVKGWRCDGIMCKMKFLWRRDASLLDTLELGMSI